MGVSGLSALLKEVASDRVDIDASDSKERQRHIIVDGHYGLQQAAGHADTALPLVLHNDVVPLAMEMASRLNMPAAAGWEIALVFDRFTPPRKANTASSRADTREAPKQRCFDLQHEVPRDVAEIGTAAKGAVHVSSAVVARVSRTTLHVCDGPIRKQRAASLSRGVYLQMGRRVLVHGTDRDLMVLGVRSLLWDVIVKGGSVYRQVVFHHAITRPQLHTLRGCCMASKRIRNAGTARGGHLMNT